MNKAVLDKKWDQQARFPLTGDAPFTIEQKGRFKIWRRLETDTSDLMEATLLILDAKLPLPRKLTTRPEGQGIWLLHGGRKSDVIGVQSDSQASFAVKCVHDSRLVAQARTFLGKGKGKRAYVRGWGLETRKIPAPRVCGYVENRPSGPCFLFMELIDPQEKLLFHLKDHPEKTTTLARSLARFVANLHRSGVAHDDLSARNLILGENDTLMLVDFEDIHFRNEALSTEESQGNLLKLTRSLPEISLREKLRFLHTYLKEMDLPVRTAEYGRQLMKP